MPHLDGRPTSTEVREEILRAIGTRSTELLESKIDDWIDEAYARGKTAGEIAERENESWREPF